MEESKLIEIASQIPGFNKHLQKRFERIENSNLFRSLKYVNVGVNPESNLGAYALNVNLQGNLIDIWGGISIIGVYDRGNFGEDTDIYTAGAFGDAIGGGDLEVFEKDTETISVRGLTMVPHYEKGKRIFPVRFDFNKNELSKKGYTGKERLTKEIEGDY